MMTALLRIHLVVGRAHDVSQVPARLGGGDPDRHAQDRVAVKLIVELDQAEDPVNRLPAGHSIGARR